MSDKLDVSYYAPVFELKLDGKDIEKIDPALKKCITSITVTKAIGQSDHIKFDVQDQMEAGQFTWLDKNIFEMGQQINAALGYSGNVSHKAEAHVQEVSTGFTSGLAPTLTIEGSHIAFTKMTKSTKELVFKEKKDSEIVKHIAGILKVGTQIEATSVKFDLKTKKSEATYMEFISNLVSENSRFEFFISEGKLFFRQAKIDESPRITLTWGQDLVSISPSADMAKMITGVVALASLNKKTSRVKVAAGIEKKVDPGKTLGSVLAKKYVGENLEYVTARPTDSTEELKALAEARLEEQNRDFVTAEGSTVGIPELSPGMCIQLEGLGQKFSGKYYVGKTVHTIDGSGYKVNFSVRSNVL